MRHCLIGIFALVIIAPAAAQPKLLPTSAYKKSTVAGFTVYVAPACFEQPEKVHQRALDLLRLKLEEVARLVPARPLAAMRKTALWIEWENGNNLRPEGSACYHVDAGWLKSNGYNPDKLKSVEISMKLNLNADMLFRDQPMMILHELAHAYHHQVLNYENKEVLAVYNQAKERKLYDRIEKVYYGQFERPQRAYAMNNQMEYFAEISEAYFGVNDFFPFTWQDLKRHDAEGWKLMERIWGPIERKEVEVKLTIRNQTERAAVVEWIDENGKRTEYGKIAAGGSMEQMTYSGHRWQARMSGVMDRYFFVVPARNATWVLK